MAPLARLLGEQVGTSRSGRMRGVGASMSTHTHTRRWGSAQHVQAKVTSISTSATISVRTPGGHHRACRASRSCLSRATFGQRGAPRARRSGFDDVEGPKRASCSGTWGCTDNPVVGPCLALNDHGVRPEVDGVLAAARARGAPSGRALWSLARSAAVARGLGASTPCTCNAWQEFTLQRFLACMRAPRGSSPNSLQAPFGTGHESRGDAASTAPRQPATSSSTSSRDVVGSLMRSWRTGVER